MSSLAFWKAVVVDESNFLERVTGMLASSGIPYCVIGGVAVNAYADPLLTQDLDVVVATDDLERIRALMASQFKLREFDHSLNVYDPGSKLQVQFQLDPALTTYLKRAEFHDVLGLTLPVAAPPDLLAAKVAAALEPRRRASKRLKDLADISAACSRHSPNCATRYRPRSSLESHSERSRQWPMAKGYVANGLFAHSNTRLNA